MGYPYDPDPIEENEKTADQGVRQLINRHYEFHNTKGVVAGSVNSLRRCVINRSAYVLSN